MKLRHHIIENRVIRQASLMEWATWLECADRHVGDSEIGTVRVSTVFIGIDMGFYNDGVPILFETMVFGEGVPALNPGFWSESMWRYRTLEEAERGHRIVCEKVKEFFPDAEIEDRECHLGEIPTENAARYSQLCAKHGL